VVTGASSGIGRALARRLAAEGLDLVLVARSAGVLEELAGELSGQHGVAARALPVDLARPTSADEVAEAVQDEDVGLLVAAAGFGTAGRFLDADPAEAAEMVDVNCRAVLGLALRLGRRMARRGRGGIVLLSSLMAFQGAPLAAGYGATKAYVQSLAEALHVELKPRGVDVLAAVPGPVRTGFAARARMELPLASEPEAVAASILAALGRRGSVRPGWLAKVLGGSLNLLPRGGRVHMMGRFMRRAAAPALRDPSP
jgi:short-subunit dehydrogenase